MSEPGQGSEYELHPLTPPANAPSPQTPAPKPGEPGWVPPVPIIEKADPEPEPEAEPHPTEDPDVQRHRGIAVLGYIFFVIPLVLAPNSKFARFHANQGLLIFILWCLAVIGTVVLTVGWHMMQNVLATIPILSFFFGCFANVIPFFLIVGVIVLTIMGIVHAANGEKTELPLLGHLALIK